MIYLKLLNNYICLIKLSPVILKHTFSLIQPLIFYE